MRGKRILTTLVAVTVLFSGGVVRPLLAWAQAYGEGNYGDGSYNEGYVVAPTSSPPGPGSAPACGETAPTGKVPWLHTAVPESSSSIRIHFTEAGEPVDTYVLEYGTGSGNYQYAASIGGKDTRAYVVKSLQPDTTYYFRVRGGNGCAVGAWSNELSATTRSRFATNQLEISNSTITPHTPETSAEGTPTPAPVESTGYVVRVRVVDTEKKPVSGAKVTLHSDPKEATTNESGVAEFSGVEGGQHRVVIAYRNYTGEQSINLSGDVQEFELNMTIKMQSPFSDYRVLGVIGFLTIGIIFLAIIAYRKSKKAI